jgi:hypothetical protein
MQRPAMPIAPVHEGRYAETVRKRLIFHWHFWRDHADTRLYGFIRYFMDLHSIMCGQASPNQPDGPPIVRGRACGRLLPSIACGGLLIIERLPRPNGADAAL